VDSPPPTSDAWLRPLERTDGSLVPSEGRPSIFLSEAIQDFARYSLDVKGYAQKTHISYQNRQRQFANRLAERENLSDIPIHNIIPKTTCRRPAIAR
jgi:hypothetical protein